MQELLAEYGLWAWLVSGRLAVCSFNYRRIERLELPRHRAWPIAESAPGLWVLSDDLFIKNGYVQQRQRSRHSALTKQMNGMTYQRHCRTYVVIDLRESIATAGCSVIEHPEHCSKSYNTKVLGRHTPWTLLVANSMAHQVQACFSYFQGYTSPYLSRLLILYRPSRVLRSTSYSNLLL